VLHIYRPALIFTPLDVRRCPCAWSSGLSAAANISAAGSAVEDSEAFEVSAIKSGELEAPAASVTADAEISAGKEPKSRGYGRSDTLPASSGTYQPEGLPPMVWSTPQHERGEDGTAGAVLTLDPAASSGGAKGSADMSGKPPMSGGGFKTPSASGGVDAPSMSGGFKTPSMSGGVETPSMSGGVKTPSMSGGVGVPSMSGGVETPSMSGGVGTPSMSGGVDLPSASPASVSFDKPTVDTGFVPPSGAGGATVTTPTTSAPKIAGYDARRARTEAPL